MRLTSFKVWDEGSNTYLSAWSLCVPVKLVNAANWVRNVLTDITILALMSSWLT